MPSFGAATFWMDRRAPVEPLRARNAPLLLAALAFAGGILLARQWHGPAGLVLSVALLAGLAMVAVGRSGAVGWLAVLALWAGVGCWCAQIQPPVERQETLHRLADGLSRTVRGRVVGVRPLRAADAVGGRPLAALAPWDVEPGGWEAESGDALQNVDLEIEAIEHVTPDVAAMEPAAGGLRITLVGGAPLLRCGAVVEVPVRLREPEIYRDPGAFSYADWLGQQGVGALGTAPATRLQVVDARPPGARCYLSEVQHWAAGRLAALPDSALQQHLPAALRLTGDDAAMLAAMLFGDRTQLSSEQRAGFERTGTFHLFVVSGLHVALVTGALFALLRRRLRLPEIPAVAATIALAAAYALLTGFGVPAQRALAMSSLFLIARALDRQHSGLNALGVAALLILVADPRALFEASFQMTSMVILAAAGMAVPLGERLLGRWRAAIYQLEVLELDAFLPPEVAERRVGLRYWGAVCRDLLHPRAAELPGLLVRGGLVLAEGVLFAVAIELCMALPVAVYFHRVAPMALPANLLVAPVAALLVGAAALTFAAALLSPWLALLPAALTAGLLHGLRGGVGWLAGRSLGDLRVPAPPAIAMVFSCGLIGFALWALRARHRGWAVAGVAAALSLPALVLWPVPPLLHLGALEVTAIDVGQGDSLLVVSPEGRTMLVDAGGPVGRVTTRWDVGEQVVAPFLWSRRLRRLDTVVISHGHSDHIGGMPAVLRDLRPRELWLSLQPGQSADMRALLAQAAQQGIAVHWLAAGDRFAWGGVQTTVLAPERTYANYGEARNDDSLVLRLDWERASVLLEGDAEAPSEAAMVAHGRLAPVSLLKVGHHGSRTSTNPEFLAAVAPRDAVISVGQHNTFGHPRWEVLDRLEAAHVKTFRTDREGARSFLLHGDGTVTATGASN